MLKWSIYRLVVVICSIAIDESESTIPILCDNGSTVKIATNFVPTVKKTQDLQDVRTGSYNLTGIVIPDFKDKIRYAPYVSFRSQISHIATNKG